MPSSTLPGRLHSGHGEGPEASAGFAAQQSSKLAPRHARGDFAPEPSRVETKLLVGADPLLKLMHPEARGGWVCPVPADVSVVHEVYVPGRALELERLRKSISD